MPLNGAFGEHGVNRVLGPLPKRKTEFSQHIQTKDKGERRK